MEHSNLLFFAILLSHAFLSYAHSASSTFYTPPYLPSACYGFLDKGKMIAAASEALWDNGAACGHSYRVTCRSPTGGSRSPCKGTSVVVKITDLCPPHSCHATVDLSQEAFAMLADPDAGVIEIRLTRIS
ncbi:hypothetical protein HPP92_007650 [Vanilla planifolia]|uniref:Expansin-like EG45 domain-containing protein n=1 Tax=Vanilla planifolia TaxID=51239 RepID=A0A835RD10_VANPL|nr:hypothetical protein HPP92_007650 [Vanilla planifolia]